MTIKNTKIWIAAALLAASAPAALRAQAPVAPDVELLLRLFGAVAVAEVDHQARRNTRLG